MRQAYKVTYKKQNDEIDVKVVRAYSLNDARQKVENLERPKEIIAVKHGY